MGGLKFNNEKKKIIMIMCGEWRKKNEKNLDSINIFRLYKYQEGTRMYNIFCKLNESTPYLEKTCDFENDLQTRNTGGRE